MIFGMLSNVFYQKCSQVIRWDAPCRLSLFANVSQGLFFEVVWLVLPPCWHHARRSCWAPCWLMLNHFGIDIGPLRHPNAQRTPAENRTHPPRNKCSFHSHERNLAVGNLDPLQATQVAAFYFLRLFFFWRTKSCFG